MCGKVANSWEDGVWVSEYTMMPAIYRFILNSKSYFMMKMACEDDGYLLHVSQNVGVDWDL